MKSRLFFGFLAILGILCAGCAVPKGPEPTTNIQELAASDGPAPGDENALEVQELNKQLFASFTSTPSYEDYVIGPGDLVQVTVFEAPDLNTEARVSARGMVTLPLIGTVKLAGRTTRDAEQHVEDLYREKYLQDPHVTIFVKEQYGSKVTLLGALNKPGTYDFYARMNLMDVLAMAEGLSDRAGRIVQIRRKAEEEDQPPQTLIIDLDQLVKEGREELNVPIRGGDVIYVPEAGSVYVDGAVRKPGSYPIRQEMSVREAIVAAGGLAPYADEENIKLIRYLGHGRREVAKLTLEEIRQGGASIKVQDRDVIFVEADPLSTFFHGLRLNLGTGLLGVGYSSPTNRYR